MITKAPFNGETEIYTISGGELSAEILTYGATVRSLRYRGVELVGGYASLDSYKNAPGYQGATIGRYANRICGGSFTLSGSEYFLKKNENGITHLHGGEQGFDKKLWLAEPCGASSLALSLRSPDGEEGYPGNLCVRVVFTVADSSLEISYEAVCDRDTIVNLTNHSYFNLNGIGSGSVLNHTLSLNSSRFDAVNSSLIPVKIQEVDGSPFDFRKEKTIGTDLNRSDEQLLIAKGYDHNFYIDGAHAGSLSLAARAKGDRSGICMEMYTDQPCVQLYTGNFLPDDYPFTLQGKQIVKQAHHAFCLEAQLPPDSPNRGTLSLLKKGEKYRQKTVYSFSRG